MLCGALPSEKHPEDFGRDADPIHRELVEATYTTNLGSWIDKLPELHAGDHKDIYGVFI